MASVQARREENFTDERDIVVQKDRVLKMATHFESLAEKAREEQHYYVPSHGEKEVGSRLQVSESESERKKREEGQKREGEAEKRVDDGGGGGEGRQGLSLEDISNLRAKAQQSSMEAISAAEVKYEKAKGAKDTTADATNSQQKVGGAGKTVVGNAGEKIAAATDAVEAMEERAAEYAARKQAEAQKELEARRASHEMGNEEETNISNEQYESKEQTEAPLEKFLGLLHGGEQDEQHGEPQQGGSILQAIGETIVEIGQTAKALLIGQNPIQVLESKVEADFMEEHYSGARRGN